MSIVRTLFACIAAALFATPAFAAPPDFLTGHWRMESEGRVLEEIWTSGEGGVYFAVNRSIRDGETAFFEFLRIETKGGIAFIAQPRGASPVRFPMVEAGENRIRFANPEHDYPKFIEYLRDGDTLIARIWDEKGEADANEFRWSLVRP